MKKKKTDATPKPKRTASKSPPVGKAAAAATERVAIEAIKLAKYNPRKDLQPSDAEYQKIRRSIEAFGFVGGMVLNKRSGVLIGGHQRLKVLVELGYTHVDVACVDLDDADERALNVALNKTGGAWDEAALIALLADLQRMEHADATLTGFDEVEIIALLDQSRPPPPGTIKASDADSVLQPYAVLVVCDNEKEQREVYDWAKSKGHKCRRMAI